MSKVFFSVTVSLDGYVAPEGMELTHTHDPDYKDWMAQWMKLQDWVFQQRFFRENLKLGGAATAETGADDAMLRQTFDRTGVSVMGKRMFSGGELLWPEEAPFHTPVFVLTHEVRSPWERPGGTTFHFVNDGLESAVRRAREVCGGRDIRIAGGADVIVQALNAGLVDEANLAVSPIVFGGGTALFAGVDRKRVRFTPLEGSPSSRVTHLRYAVSAS